MSDYQWTGGANTGDFATPGNWRNATTGLNPATSAPGPADIATIGVAGATISGAGSVATLNLQGTAKILGELDASSGSTGASGVNLDGHIALRPDAALTTVLLNLGTSANFTGALHVGESSGVVIAGVHPQNNYAISIAAAAGSTGKVVVHGPGAFLDGGNEPLSVGQNGLGVLRIEHGGVVTAGNLDPAIGFAVVIGNHAGSNGRVEIEDASLLTAGAILVGRSAPGVLDIGPAGLVAAGNMFIGQNAAGVGSVVVRGAAARLVLANILQVGVAGEGALEIKDGGLVSAGVSATLNGPVTLDKGRLAAPAVSIGATGAVAGEGALFAAGGFANSGAITADHRLDIVGPMANGGVIELTAGSRLTLAGPLSGAGSIVLEKGTAAHLDAAAAGQKIIFAGTGATLILRRPGAFAAVVQGFGEDDSIEIDGAATGLALAGGVMILTGPGGTVAQIALTGAYAAADLHLTAAPDGRSIVRFHAGP